MSMNLDPRMEKLNRFLLACECAPNLRQFMEVIASEIGKIVSFEFALGLHWDSNNKIQESFSVNYPDQWLRAFKSYYGQVVFQFDLGNFEKDISGYDLYVVNDWKTVPLAAPHAEYLKACGIVRSIYLIMHDTYGFLRSVLSLEKGSNIPFTESEIDSLRFLYPHLDNLHKKFFQFSDGLLPAKTDALLNVSQLTKREIEITKLLCQGVSPVNISKALNITIGTVQKHIANVYEKLAVSTIQELLVRLLA